ncbi:hypothetical protein [Actinomyces sp. oral taxon 414]|uniref:hypothetical protein n=1 Tax=Actinomyces sp. oral taxon 414 TaxID=712122 RepID=UPI000AE33E70|nr:hypothetical protein [Actinomyces sp. oral taxon 414]
MSTGNGMSEDGRIGSAATGSGNAMSGKTGGGTTMGGRGITGICLTVCGVLTVIWGGAQEPVDVTSPDFMSFATGGMVLLAIGALLIPGLPSVCTIAAVWATALTSAVYIFALPEAEALVKLIGVVPVVGLAVWLTIRARS